MRIYAYKIGKVLALVPFILWQLVPDAAAQTAVSGTVKDARSGETLPGVNISIQGTTAGTSTNAEGEFSMEVPSLQDTLIFSFVGYQTQEIPIRGRSKIDVSLQAQAIAGEELVVVGYGTQERSDLSSSISSVSREEIQKNATLSNTAAALEGTTPGVSATPSSGEPGASYNIRIRGLNSFGNNDPLIIIDGVPGSLSNINPQDIDNMQVLKDAAAAAIYGSRAANGVIIVTTNKGWPGKATMTFNSSYGIQEAINTISVTNAEQYARIDNALHEATNGDIPAFDQLDDPESLGKGTNWQDELYNTAPILKTYLGVSGGNDNSTYSISGSFDKREGIAESTWYRKGSLHYNGQQNVGIITFSESITYTDRSQRMMPYGGDKPLTLQTLLAQPIFPVYNEENEGGYAGAPGFLPAQGYNPVGLANLQENTYHNNSLNTKISMEVDFLQNLTYKLNAGYRVQNVYNKNYTPKYFFSAQRQSQRAMLSETRSRTNHWIIENTLNYRQNFDNHSLSILLGFSAEEDHYRNTGASMEGFPNNELQVISAGTGYSTGVSGNDYRWTMYSLLGRINYNYDDKYYLTANIRRDGSSRFGPNNRYGIFPSASIAWRISNEKFFAPFEGFLTDFKLRGSYGELGNQPTSNYSYIPVIGYNPSLGYIFADEGNFQSGAAVQNFANPLVKWESTRSLDVGADVEIMSKVDLTFDYFHHKTNNLLLNVPIPPSTGTGSPPLVNTGKVQNQGVELSIAYNSLNQGSEFNYSISGNLSTVRNTVLELGYEGQIIYGSSPHRAATGPVTAAKVGYPMSGFFMLEEVGLFQSQQEINNYTNQDGGLIQPNAQPGDVKYVDANNDGQINNDDAVYSGSPIPDFSFGLNFSGNYKNFDFTLFLQGEYGKKMFDANTWITNRGTVDYNFNTDMLNAWTPNNKDTDVPRLTFSDPNHNSYPSTRFLYDATYLRIKTLQVGYSLSQQVLSQFGISNLRFYVSTSNMLTLTDYPGYDPSYTNDGLLNRGLDQGLYPVSRILTAGIEMKF